MKEVKVQEKSDSEALWVYIPKHIVEHFGIKKGDTLYVGWDESDPKNPKIVYHLKKPVRSPELVGGVRKEREAEVQK